MSIYDLEAAFGAADKTSRAMRRAIGQWFSLYYGNPEDSQADPCQRIAYTVVNKLIRNVFAEYKASARTQADCLVLEGLEPVARQAMQLALVGGECYLKPCPEEAGFSFALIPRCNALIFGRGADGTPCDVGLCACSTHGRYYYTLLERRYRQDGELVIENRLFRSKTGDRLGEPVPLNSHPDYAQLPEQSRLSLPWGVGLVTVRTPMLNCVDGSCEGVSVYAAAAGLIEHIDRNEAQLAGEFRRGQSRVFASADLLGQSGALESDLFVGLDEDPQQVGITVFAPELRVDAYLARKKMPKRSGWSACCQPLPNPKKAGESKWQVMKPAVSCKPPWSSSWSSCCNPSCSICGRVCKALPKKPANRSAAPCPRPFA